MILFPAIDLKDGACVRLKLGLMEDATVFNTDPGAQAESFAAAGAQWIHVVDLNGAFAGKPVNAAAVDAIFKTLLAARDIEHDSGRTNLAKPYKGGTPALLAANFKRIEEALRVLEEYGRVLAPGAVKKAQALRFKTYKLEKTVGADLVSARK